MGYRLAGLLKGYAGTTQALSEREAQLILEPWTGQFAIVENRATGPVTSA